MSVSLAYYCYCRTNDRGYIAVCSVVDPHRTEVESHYLKGRAIVRKLLVLHRSVSSQTAVRHSREYFGGPLVEEVRAHMQKHEWQQAMRGLLVLLRYYPKGFASVLHSR